jgi:hypothetical protein
VPDNAPAAAALLVAAAALAAAVVAAGATGAAADLVGGGVVVDGDVLHAATSTTAGATRIANLAFDIASVLPRLRCRVVAPVLGRRAVVGGGCCH